PKGDINRHFINNLLKSERCDPSIVWNLHLFSHLLKSNGTILLENMHGIREILRIYRPTTNKECISNMTSCYNNLIISLTRIYPIENRSVDYTLAFEDEKEFFSQHLPFRDWGKYISPDELKIKYHIPNVQEISAALDITSSVLNESMSFLKKSFLRKNESRDFRSTKEDNYRELNYIYHLVYSSSCLLKRPSSKKNVDEQLGEKYKSKNEKP
ncbi:proteasome activator complex subunit 4, partial [Brachionus plicatilis]